MCRSEMNSVATKRLSAPNGCDPLDFFDDHRLYRRVFLEWTLCPRRARGDVVDDVHAFDDLAEHGVAPTGLARVEGAVVVDVYVKLAIAAVRLRAARRPTVPR